MDVSDSAYCAPWRDGNSMDATGYLAWCGRRVRWLWSGLPLQRQKLR